MNCPPSVTGVWRVCALPRLNWNSTGDQKIFIPSSTQNFGCVNFIYVWRAANGVNDPLRRRSLGTRHRALGLRAGNSSERSSPTSSAQTTNCLNSGENLCRLETWVRNLPVPSVQAAEPRVDERLSHFLRISEHTKIATTTQIPSHKMRYPMDVFLRCEKRIT